SYKIQMINAASDSLLFRNITIFENEQDIDTQTMNISTLMNEAVENQVRNIIFTEPSNNDASISKDAIRHIQNVIVVNDWYTENLTTNIQQLKQFCAGLNSEIHIIGYGPHSNIAARAIGQKLRCKTFVTYHEDKDLIDKMAAIISDDDVNDDCDVTVYCQNADYIQQQHVANILNYTRYLQKIDESMLNRGGLNET
ncbi:hypothetical protein, partial [Staphylococcus kloosii]|uniref:hypothetical protein n=1 Tax=Staphylococcus kloosii TaxID=29384 RepID=UPI003B9760AC